MLFQSKCQSSASGLRPAKRPIATAGTKSAPVARKRASASGKVKIPGFVICSVAFSIPRAGFFKLYSIRTANPNKTPSTRLYRSDYAKKLTKVIAGRTVKAATVEAGGVLVLFDDESKMKIKTTGTVTIQPGRTRRRRQSG
jgi:hypothetical protein